MAKKQDNYLNRKILVVFYVLFTAVLISYLAKIGYRGLETAVQSEFETVTLSGRYSLDGGETYSNLQKFSWVKGTYCDKVIFEGYVSKDIEAGDVINFFLQGIEGKVYVNDRQLLNYQGSTDDPWTYIVSPGISVVDVVRVELTCTGKHLYDVAYSRFFSRIYIGNKYEVLKHLLGINLPFIIASIIILIMGICMLIYRVLFRRIREYNSEGITFCGIMLLIGGATCLVDYNYITLIFGNHLFLEYMDFILQALMVIFLIGYIKRYMVTERYRRRNDGCVMLSMALMTTYMLKVIGQYGFINEDRYKVILIVVGAIILIIEMCDLFVDNRNGRVDSHVAFVSTILLIIGCIFEIVYVVLTGVYYVKILQLDLLVFAFIQYYLIVTTNATNYSNVQRAQDLENELTQSRIKMMLSQIQPHFLYNALGTIRALCLKNPEEARNALDYFSRYLRSNMDSLDQEGCIPFRKELEHVESYLYIEKLRFGDLLNIEYDIQSDNFEIPALSLQTMAENAVKHGLLAKKDGGTLKISTRESENCYEITIQDNGVGFDMMKPLDTSRSHIGVVNTRQRIMGICNGTLSIGSKVGVGTTITITIPKKN